MAPAIKVIVWDCFFLALGGQRPFWQPEAFLGAFLSRFESVESGALFRKNKRFSREGSKKRGFSRARRQYSLRAVHFLEKNKRFSRERSKKRGFSRARQRYSLRVVHFCEKTSVLVERGRKNAASPAKSVVKYVGLCGPRRQD